MNVNHTADLRNIGCTARVTHTCFQGCVCRHGRGDEWMQVWLQCCRPLSTGPGGGSPAEGWAAGGWGSCEGGMISPTTFSPEPWTRYGYPLLRGLSWRHLGREG